MSILFISLFIVFNTINTILLIFICKKIISLEDFNALICNSISNIFDIIWYNTSGKKEEDTKKGE